MAAKQEFLIALLIGIAAYVTSNSCPPYWEVIPSCSCSDREYMLFLNCNKGRENTFEDVRDELVKYNISTKHNIALTFSDMREENALTSKIFEGFDIKNLEFRSCRVTRWADEEGGPAFVGLEDSLENLDIYGAIFMSSPKKNQKALMTLGHLRKLKKLSITVGPIHNFGNDWFGEGGSSVEQVSLQFTSVRSIGDRAFAGLTNLRSIEIRDNPLRAISRSMFPNPANNLREFSLTVAPYLETLPSDLFTNMPALNYVNLHYSSITHLPEVMWKPIWSQLGYLAVSGNDIHCDDHINWMFELRRPKKLVGTCESPKSMKDKRLSDIIDKKTSE